MSEQSWRGTVTVILASILAALNTLIGGWDKVMAILGVFILLDFVSGWMRAFILKELSSDESWRGVAKKVLIFVIVAVAAQVDRFTGATFVRNAACAFYCATEGLSIIENCAAADVLVPGFLRDALKKLGSEKFPATPPGSDDPPSE